MNMLPLHRAALAGNAVEAATLLTGDADPAVRDGEGRTPLHHAVMRGHLDLVDLLLLHGGPRLLMIKDILGCTPIHLAAVQNQVMLIVKLAEALKRDTEGTSPLHEIVRRGCMQDFMGFLHLGWDSGTSVDELVQLQSKGALESAAWAAAGALVDITRPGFRVVQRVLGWGPLHVAAVEGLTDLMPALVKEHGCDLLARSTNSWTPLHYAAGYNQVAAIEMLVSLGCPVDVRDSVFCTPLHVAAGEGHLQAIVKLVQLGCEPSVRDRDGCSPLYCAAAWNRFEAVQLLEQMGCPSGMRSDEGRTAVHVASEQGWVQLLEYLLSRPGIDNDEQGIEIRDAYSSTPLHSAANGGHELTISCLVQRGHSLNPKDYLGRTPLHYAAMHGRTIAVEQLVRLGASIEEPDWRGQFTPLHLAADAGQVDVIAKLVELGADVNVANKKGWTPLVLSTVKGPSNVDAIRLLVELGASVQPVLDQSNIETPLHVAARSGRVYVIERLLHCGVSVMLRTKDGSTALHYAAAFGQTHVVEVLVRSGCPVDARDNANNTPLHLAAGCGFKDTIVKLVELGADVNARDITDCTPLQNAAHGTYSALANMPAEEVPPKLQGGHHGPGTPALTPAQQAAQAVLTNPNPNPVKKGNLVPVRTGLAWATFGVPCISNHKTTALASSAGLLEAACNDGSTDWRGFKLMQLLKRASKRYSTEIPVSFDNRGGSPAHSKLPALASGPELGPLGLAPPGTPGGLQRRDLGPVQAPEQQSMAGQLAKASRMVHQWQRQYLQDDRYLEGEYGLEALLRRTEQALQLAGHEADRGRLVPVTEALLQLGADLGAVDNEGRTALHLASGCGDKNMVLRLVELGSDVNARDSVGGTPMHHAAMANKKDIMFVLARLGCDWRAKADGIDGATAAYVLCGQHGKTTRQQKLLEAKLKRGYQEGVVLRAAGMHSLTGDLQAALGAPVKGAALGAGNHQEQVAAELQAASLLADQNMAALLLEEESQEGVREAATKRKKKKKRAKKPTDVDAFAGSEAADEHNEGDADGQESDDAESTAPSGWDSARTGTAAATEGGPVAVTTRFFHEDASATQDASGAERGADASANEAAIATQQREHGYTDADYATPNRALSPSVAGEKASTADLHPAAQHSGANCADVSLTAEGRADDSDAVGVWQDGRQQPRDGDVAEEVSEQDAVRHSLDVAAASAAELCREGASDRQAEGQTANFQRMEDALAHLDEVITQASKLTVSAKYAKKVRKRLHAAITAITNPGALVSKQGPKGTPPGPPHSEDDTRSVSRASTTISEAVPCHIQTGQAGTGEGAWQVVGVNAPQPTLPGLVPAPGPVSSSSPLRPSYPAPPAQASLSPLHAANSQTAATAAALPAVSSLPAHGFAAVPQQPLLHQQSVELPTAFRPTSAAAAPSFAAVAASGRSLAPNHAPSGTSGNAILATGQDGGSAAAAVSQSQGWSPFGGLSGQQAGIQAQLLQGQGAQASIQPSLQQQQQQFRQLSVHSQQHAVIAADLSSMHPPTMPGDLRDLGPSRGRLQAIGNPVDGTPTSEQPGGYYSLFGGSTEGPQGASAWPATMFPPAPSTAGVPGGPPASLPSRSPSVQSLTQGVAGTTPAQLQQQSRLPPSGPSGQLGSMLLRNRSNASMSQAHQQQGVDLRSNGSMAATQGFAQGGQVGSQPNINQSLFQYNSLNNAISQSLRQGMGNAQMPAATASGTLGTLQGALHGQMQGIVAQQAAHQAAQHAVQHAAQQAAQQAATRAAAMSALGAPYGAPGTLASATGSLTGMYNALGTAFADANGFNNALLHQALLQQAVQQQRQAAVPQLPATLSQADIMAYSRQLQQQSQGWPHDRR